MDIDYSRKEQLYVMRFEGRGRGLRKKVGYKCRYKEYRRRKNHVFKDLKAMREYLDATVDASVHIFLIIRDDLKSFISHVKFLNFKVFLFFVFTSTAQLIHLLSKFKPIQ